MFLPNFLHSLLLSVIPLLCLFIHCHSIRCVISLLLFVCVPQSVEAMLSAMVEVADALVTDMFQAKTCYRKIFSV